MNEWFLTNRDIIKDLSFNTGTTASPVWTNMCTTSEVTLTTDFNTTDFYVFCDSIQRSLITGSSVTLSCTVKLDINNGAIQKLIGDIHTLIKDGSIAQFNNQKLRFKLLDDVNNNVLTYKHYEANANLVFSDLGGAAEAEGEFSLEIHLLGTASEVPASV